MMVPAMLRSPLPSSVAIWFDLPFVLAISISVLLRRSVPTGPLSFSTTSRFSGCSTRSPDSGRSGALTLTLAPALGVMSTSPTL